MADSKSAKALANAGRLFGRFLPHRRQEGKVLVYYEGERVIPEEDRPENMWVEMVKAWRPEGKPIPPGIEPIPGYQRPVNFREIEAAENEGPGAFEVEFEPGVVRRYEVER